MLTKDHYTNYFSKKRISVQMWELNGWQKHFESKGDFQIEIINKRNHSQRLTKKYSEIKNKTLMFIHPITDQSDRWKKDYKEQFNNFKNIEKYWVISF